MTIALGVYMLLMGIIGYIRTKSPTALFVNGGIALGTILLGCLAGKAGTTLFSITLGWLVVVTLVLIIMTLKRLRAGAAARRGSVFIFGSMAVFSLLVLAILSTKLI